MFKKITKKATFNFFDPSQPRSTWTRGTKNANIFHVFLGKDQI